MPTPDLIWGNRKILRVGLLRMNNASEILQRLGLARIAAMGLVAVLMLGFFAFLIFRITSPQLAPLYSGLSFDDSAAIVAKLQSTGVPHEVRGQGETILVPRDRITAIRMELAGDGLPTAGQVGYEIFDTQSTLGATSFVQDVNLVRAMEGELARTITSLARIQTARVHLVLPKRELFRRERQDPSASITLGVRGVLSGSEISAIQHLVSAAVEGMSPNQVSIIDSAGRLLAAGNGDDSATAISGDLAARADTIETRLRTRLEEMLANIVGPGRVRVQVSAELNFNRQTTTIETYDPDGQVVRSTQSRELDNSSSSPANGGPVSIGNELPGNVAEGAGNASTENSSTTEETINYEISKSTQTEINEAGSIKRISVAVVVDGIYTQDASGASLYQPRSDAEIEQIRALVRAAIGFDANRGDQLDVINMQFAERPDIAAVGTEGPSLLDFTRDDLMSAAEMLVTLLVSIALMLFVMRPLIKRVLEPEAPMPLPAPTEMGPAPTNAAEALEAVAEAADAPEPAYMNKARSEGEAQSRALESVGDLVVENPKQASVIVRDWLHQAA